MSAASLAFTFGQGTHRVCSPAETLARIAPQLEACGITRLTDVTQLDHLGVPVYCAIRPAGRVLQVSNGKGMTREAAQVSALMEAVELHHAENPEPARLRVSCEAELAAAGLAYLSPTSLPGWQSCYHAPTHRFEWIEGSRLSDGAPVWAPASLACFARDPAPLLTDTNGLASGNHLLEASLHGLYELLERDALAALSVDGRLHVRERCRVIDPATLPDPALRALVQRIENCATRVVLMWVPSRVPVTTFWAVLLNRRPGAPVSTLNLGAGCHLDPVVAAARAITEGAQARLTLIHGAREDRARKPVSRAEDVRNSAAYRYFDDLSVDTPWSSLPRDNAGPSTLTLDAVHDWLVAALWGVGIEVVRFDLSRADIGIPVVKMLARGLAFNQRLL